MNDVLTKRSLMIFLSCIEIDMKHSCNEDLSAGSLGQSN